MNVLDLFSGIGGFSLGLERAGMRTVAFCEIDPFARCVLGKRWPGVPIFEDVRKLCGEDDGSLVYCSNEPWSVPGPVDVICGGFPCQDISTAGKGAGIDGARSGLWSEYARIIGEVRPHYVIVENVAALLGRGLDRVLGDLAALGYDAEWHCIPASAVGAPHRRDRIWIISYPGHGRKSEWPRSPRWQTGERETERGLTGCDGQAWHLADVPHATYYASISEGIRRGDTAGQWWIEPDVGRVAHGISSRVDRLGRLGNAVVPQIPEIIGRAIMRASQ